MPTSTGSSTSSRKQRPVLRHYASEALLDRFTRDLAVRVGAAAPELAGGSAQGGRHAARPFTVDVLRALDEGDSTRDRIPGWLVAAQRTADRELRVWYARRGIPDPHGVPDRSQPLPDPGEPQSVEEEAAYWRACPRPNPETREQQIVEFLKCRASLPYFVDSYLHLRQMGAGVIPFRLWRWQGWLLEEWQRHRFCVNLKGRQLGVSELAAAISFHEILFHATKTVLLMSIGEDEAQVLLGRAATMLEHLPVWLTPETRVFKNPHLLLAVSLSKLNTTEMEFAHLDSAGRTHTSGMESLPATQRAGRSRTASTVILDEHAHQMWATEIWGAVKPTISTGGRILSISTANGVGNLFYKLWDGMTREPTAGEFVAFLAWRRHPERDEAWYAAEKRGFAIAGTPELIHQEDPSEPGEAFIQSGRPVFDQTYLNEHERRIGEEEAQRRAEGLPDWREVDGLTIYEEPVAGHDYIIGADVAEGLATGDFSDAVVVDRQTGREVAALHGHWPEIAYAAKLDELGHRYNTALLAVERVNHGRAVLSALLEGIAHERWARDGSGNGGDGVSAASSSSSGGGKRLAYPHLYYFKDDTVPGQHQQRSPGWDTNIRTKPQAIDKLKAMLFEGTFLPRNRMALQEMRIYSFDDEGRMGAPKSYHDDAVMSRAIAVYLLSQPNMAQWALGFVREMNERVQASVAKQRAATGVGASSAPGTHAGGTAASSRLARLTNATPAQGAAGLGISAGIVVDAEPAKAS